MLDQAQLGHVDSYVTRGGILFKEINGNLCVVVPKSMQAQIVRQVHEKGHFSKTKALLRNDFWIPNVEAKIEKVIRNCVACYPCRTKTR